MEAYNIIQAFTT